MDALKLNFYSNLFHNKGEGRVYMAMKNELINGIKAEQSRK